VQTQPRLAVNRQCIRNRRPRHFDLNRRWKDLLALHDVIGKKPLFSGEG